MRLGFERETGIRSCGRERPLSAGARREAARADGYRQGMMTLGVKIINTGAAALTSRGRLRWPVPPRPREPIPDTSPITSCWWKERSRDTPSPSTRSCRGLTTWTSTIRWWPAAGSWRWPNRLVGLERRLSDAGRGRDGFHAAVKVVGAGPEDLGLLPCVVAELAAAGFGEVAVDPLWRDLDESTDVIRQCRAALGPCAGSLREWSFAMGRLGGAGSPTAEECACRTVARPQC